MTPPAAEEFRDGLERPTARGCLEDDGGTLRVALDVGSVERCGTDDGEYVIRPARQDDFDGLVAVIRGVTAEDTYVVTGSIAGQLPYEGPVARHDAVESRVFFVAAVDGEVVGRTHIKLPQVDEFEAPPS